MCRLDPFRDHGTVPPVTADGVASRLQAFPEGIAGAESTSTSSPSHSARLSGIARRHHHHHYNARLRRRRGGGQARPSTRAVIGNLTWSLQWVCAVLEAAI